MPGGRDDSFERALDEARRQDQRLSDGGPGQAGGPRVRASLELGPEPGSGGEARFGLALDWTDEPADRLERPPSASTSQAARNRADTAAEIAAELGLAGPLTLDQLGRRWRNFVWRNHPDRQPADERERANARVAIANTLYDRARRELAKQR
jgi:hypothetical protein